MRKCFKVLAVVMIAGAVIFGCNKENGENDTEAFSFVVYPGSRYLPDLTELTKRAHKVLSPNEPEAPPTAIYDTDASLEDVASYYAKSYGYTTVAPDATNNLSAAKPQAYYRSGDLALDTKAIQPLLQKMGVTTDASKATGGYRAAEISPKSNRPRVTVQRPYFDVTKSQVVDRTLILMAR
ncbi:MAG: hypothetical protein ACXVJT_07355 [Thermoanaerobaculia bacterium]